MANSKKGCWYEWMTEAKIDRLEKWLQVVMLTESQRLRLRLGFAVQDAETYEPQE